MKANHNKNNKIFRVNNGTIQIYNFEPIYSRIALFRLKEMKKIDEDEQVITKEGPLTWFSPKKGLIYECGSYVLRRTPPKTFDEKEKNYELVKQYIDGIFTNASVHVIKRKDIEGKSIIILNPKHGISGRKVQITPDLYLEYLLENERFAAEMLQTADLSKESYLFNISDQPVMECSLDSLTNLINSGLVKGDLDDKLDLLDGSTKVYEKLKQAKK